MITTVIMTAFLALYIGFLCYLLVMLPTPAREYRSSLSDDASFPGVSVVIPFRNEARHLGPLIGSLAAQTYQGPFEILLVNDESADDYHTAIQSAPPCTHTVTILDSRFSPDRDLTSKQQALDLGIKSASYRLIALTDADMVLNRDWLERLVATRRKGADLAFGHTVIGTDRSSGFFAWFQAFQLEMLFAIAYAFHKAGVQGSCMGNNMLFSRAAYEAVGGYEKIGYSIVEDRDLFAAFRKKGLRTMATEPFVATAQTYHCTELSRYYHQLLRWACGGFRLNSNLSVFGLATAIFLALLFCAPTGLLPPLIALTAYCGFFVTWLFIAATFKTIASKENAWLFPPFFGMLLCESLFIMISLAVRQPLRWKERRI